MGMFKTSSVLCFNKSLIVPNKNGYLQFIQNLQPMNEVITQNLKIWAECRQNHKRIYGKESTDDMYLDYDQFQLNTDSRDIIT